MAYSSEEIDEIFDKITDLIVSGRSLKSILRDKNMPGINTFFKWVDSSEIKKNQYARAMELRAEMKFESIMEDYEEEPQRDSESGRIDSAWVALQRLKIDSKKWELSKLMPKKYGDRIELDNKHSGELNIISLGSGKKPNESNS